MDMEGLFYSISSRELWAHLFAIVLTTDTDNKRTLPNVVIVQSTLLDNDVTPLTQRNATEGAVCCAGDLNSQSLVLVGNSAKDRSGTQALLYEFQLEGSEVKDIETKALPPVGCTGPRTVASTPDSNRVMAVLHSSEAIQELDLTTLRGWTTLSHFQDDSDCETERESRSQYKKEAYSQLQAGTIYYRGRLYLIGGILKNTTNKCWAYNPTTGGWNRLADMKTKRRNFGLCSVPDREWLISVGGCDGRVALPTIEKYDIKSNQWRQCPVTLQQPREAHQTLVMGEYLIVVGGLDKRRHPMRNAEAIHLDDLFRKGAQFQESSIFPGCIPTIIATGRLISVPMKPGKLSVRFNLEDASRETTTDSTPDQGPHSPFFVTPRESLAEVSLPPSTRRSKRTTHTRGTQTDNSQIYKDADCISEALKSLVKWSDPVNFFFFT
eukprot:Protomagalhaensia_sp_Gyna_25__39@NODE_1019_length_2285_cov_409_428762_g812_i0_p1_GENE_NODE_1019_length_2285_cov_409_428762_g812_i0NODE_1019_length_2285_cov_409_428762_g812_i0_p1_ORF_typecomplete_len437_score29_78Kelch_1/PF01344_25/1_2e07Kelch_1/PF01344_25/4_5e07Kelch_1/PF01344_25/0_97Kelch_6/PF13964_6/1_8e04Kelch_6/PF13964_6/3_1e07Kelch_6/PF13964_6/0_00052Kelch_6/PF13964_6/0_25Kelch_4/PF13418_6/9_2e06Kelch_4/PF13418_6/0_00066Kelch_4/PF13418_6/1_1e02Kelch_3/PF13415_6/7_8e03Kelch_3/PF13415_6/1_6e0